MYVHFSKPETYLIFEKELLSITRETETMGIEELAIKILREEAREDGWEEGQAGIVKHLIHTQGLNDEQIANITGLAQAFIAKVRASLGQEGKGY